MSAVAKILLAVAALLLAGPPLIESGAVPEYAGHVIRVAPSPDGRDSDVLDRALASARRYRAAHADAAITIALAPGTYRLTRTLALGAADSGSAGKPLRIVASGPDPVILSGAYEPAERALPPDLAALVPSGARPHLRAYALPAELVASFALGAPASAFKLPHDAGVVVMQGMTALDFSGLPAEGYMRVDIPHPQPGPVVKPIVPIAPSRAVLLAKEPAPLAEGYWTHDWVFERQPIVRVDTGRSTMSLGALTTRYREGDAVRYRIVNAFAAIDRPGRFAIDPSSGTLVLWPLSEAPVAVARLAATVAIANAHDITLDGIAIVGAQGDAVRVSRSANIAIDNAYLGLSAGNGAFVLSGHDVVIANSVIDRTGQSGVVLNSGTTATLDPGRLTLRNTIVTRFGSAIRSYAPGVKLSGVGNTVQGSLIADGPHAAIIVAGNDNRVEGNEIARVANETSDVGAIYMDRDLSSRGIVISGNYLHDIQPAGTGYIAREPLLVGVYLDDFTSGVTIDGNVFRNVSTSILVNGGRDNIISRNVFVAGGSPAIWIRDTGFSWNAPNGKQAQASIGKITPAMARRYGIDIARLKRWNGVARGNVLRGNFLAGAPSVSIARGIEGLQSAGQPVLLPPLGRDASLTAITAALRRTGRPAAPDLRTMDRRTALAGLRYAGLSSIR